MQTFSEPETARQFVLEQRQSGCSVGLVPTMGALHEGHLSLVQMSRQRCDCTVATVFVNPSQFGPGEDYQQYPRRVEDDLELLARAGVAAVLIPTAATMYPAGHSTVVEPPQVGRRWEGEFRPDHFRGVTTVVMKLFGAVPATHAFFGRKDYQQWKVIAAMVRDLNVGIEIVAGPTVREPDGLALSSRNQYLSASEREIALRLSQGLSAVAAATQSGSRDVVQLQRHLRQMLGEAEGGVDKIDYAVIVDAENLEPLERLERAAVALVAAYVGPTRLIDNRELLVI